jgi:hypothetical protein
VSLLVTIIKDDKGRHNRAALIVPGVVSVCCVRGRFQVDALFSVSTSIVGLIRKEKAVFLLTVSPDSISVRLVEGRLCFCLRCETKEKGKERGGKKQQQTFVVAAVTIPDVSRRVCVLVSVGPVLVTETRNHDDGINHAILLVGIPESSQSACLSTDLLCPCSHDCLVPGAVVHLVDLEVRNWIVAAVASLVHRYGRLRRNEAKQTHDKNRHKATLVDNVALWSDHDLCHRFSCLFAVAPSRGCFASLSRVENDKALSRAVQQKARSNERSGKLSKLLRSQ